MCWRVERGLPPCEGVTVPLLDTPQIAQRRPHSCAEAAFETLFRFHFPRKPFPPWGELCDPVRGMGPDALELLVRKEFPNVCAGHLDLAHLRFLSSFTPVICIVTLAPDLDHWLCVRGVTSTRVYVQDPNPDSPRRHYAHAEWLKAWTDSTAGGCYERFAIAGWR